MMFQEGYVKTVRGWALASFVFCLAIAAWRGYSLWRSHKAGKGVDINQDAAAADVEGGNYTTMA